MSDYSSRNKRSYGWLIWSAVAVAVVSAIGWFVLAVWLDITHAIWSWFLHDIWRSWLFPDGWNLLGATPFFWLLVLVIGVVGVSIMLASRSEAASRSTTRNFTIVAIAAAVAWALFAGNAIFMFGKWNGEHYNAATTYVVADDQQIPNTLTRIHNSDRAQIEVTEGTMPDTWEPRVASVTGATRVMRRTGDSNANTELMEDTLAYIYEDGSKGAWTGIRNGKNRQPIFGVASWAGNGETIQTCEFKGDHELDKALYGTWGMNLNDDISEFDPNFVYTKEDIYGYCDNDKPVIVIPGIRATSTHVQRALDPFGVMIITGSPSGEPVIELRDTVEPGDLPGPAYPVKLTAKQRDALSWSAGRIWPWEPEVGFEPTDSAAQAGNSTDFLLRSKEDGRLYWVTPMKPRNTDSQTIVAYAMIPADEIKQGELNPQRIYVLGDNDQNIVNFDDLEVAVTTAISQKDSGFFTGNEDNVGQIVEFVPTGTGTWTVFAERGGRAIYQINVSGGARLHTTVITLDDEGELSPNPSPELPPSDSDSNGCDSPAALSDQQIAQCISELSGELMSRH